MQYTVRVDFHLNAVPRRSVALRGNVGVGCGNIHLVLQ